MPFQIVGVLFGRLTDVIVSLMPGHSEFRAFSVVCCRIDSHCVGIVQLQRERLVGKRCRYATWKSA